jgi:hypothetical protein
MNADERRCFAEGPEGVERGFVLMATLAAIRLSKHGSAFIGVYRRIHSLLPD